MGLSQQIGASSLIKPGVINNAAQRPASPYEGQVIFQKDTDQMLVWNGAAWVIPNAPAQNPMGLELVKTATCSSGGTSSGGIVTIGSAVSAVTIANAFSATYDNYRLMCNFLTSSAQLSLLLTFGSTTTGYYSTKVLSQRFDGGAGVSASINNGASMDLTSVGIDGGGGTSIDFYSPFLAEETKVTGTAMYGAITAGATINVAGVLNNNTSYTGFTLTTSANTITGGTIRIYGYRNS